MRYERYEQRGRFIDYEPEDGDDEYDPEDPKDPEENFPLWY